MLATNLNFLHSQDKDADTVIGNDIEIPAVADEEAALVPAQVEAVVVRVAGVGTHPIIFEWDTFTSRLVMGCDETSNEINFAEVTQVVSWQFETRTKFGK